MQSDSNTSHWDRKGLVLRSQPWADYLEKLKSGADIIPLAQKA